MNLTFIKKFSKKNIILVLVFGNLLFIFLNFLYNQTKEANTALAQAPPDFPFQISQRECQEIPIGKTTDSASDLLEEVVARLSNMPKEALAVTDSAEKFADLPSQCQASNCYTSCGVLIKDKIVCNPPLSCSGDPCPSQEINSSFEDIENKWNSVNNSYEIIQTLTTKERQNIFKNLDISRLLLSGCYTSGAAVERALEAGSDVQFGKWLFNCQEAKGVGLLENCYENNYFCCE